MVQEFLSLLTVLVFAVLAALVRIYVPLAIQALNRKAEAVLGTANRDALYAAVKVGLNAANKHGLNGDDLIQKAIAVASMYLNQHRIPVSTALLNEAIQAEQQKRDDRKAEFGVLTLSDPEPVQAEFDRLTFSQAYAACYDSFHNKQPFEVAFERFRNLNRSMTNEALATALNPIVPNITAHTSLAQDEVERALADAVAKAVKAQV